jgi:hypothetical protein
MQRDEREIKEGESENVDHSILVVDYGPANNGGSLQELKKPADSLVFCIIIA